VFRSKAVLAGSPTINKGILNAVAGILEEIEGLRFKNKKAASFARRSEVARERGDR